MMENLNEKVQEPGRSPMSPQQYVPVGLPPKDYLQQDPRHKSPVLATVMSLIPGIGQIYVGYYQQGFINICVIAGLITLLAHDGVSGHLKPFLAIFMVFYWFFNLVDAYRKSIFYNQVLAGLGALDIPEGEQLPGARGSLFAGLVMILAGAIALSYTVFGIPMEWIERWWPVALILLGAFLLYQSIAAKNKAQKR
jgi:hypothetical protein